MFKFLRDIASCWLCPHVDCVIFPHFLGSTSLGLLDFEDDVTVFLRMSVTIFQSVRRTIPEELHQSSSRKFSKRHTTCSIGATLLTMFGVSAASYSLIIHIIHSNMSCFIFGIDFLVPQRTPSFILKTGVTKMRESLGKDWSLFFTYFLRPDVKRGKLLLAEAWISISLTV